VSAHLPGLVLPLGRAPGPSALRLSVTTDEAGALRVDLSDPDGGALLRRRVAPEAGGRVKPGDCVALAETAALIVDRYWHEVGYEIPPPPAPPKPPPAAPPAAVEPKPAPAPPPAAAAPPAPVEKVEKIERPVPGPAPPPPRPPDLWIAAGISGETGDRGPRHGSVSLSLAVERAAFRQRLGLRFSVTGRNGDVVPSDSDGGKTTIVQVPVALDVYLAFPIGLGRLEPGLGVDLNLIYAASTQGNASDSRLAAAPGFDALLAWTIPLGYDIFLRTLATGVVGVPSRVVNDLIHKDIFETPRLRAELGLQLGLWFY
jgi:hypothetical protein